MHLFENNNNKYTAELPITVKCYGSVKVNDDESCDQAVSLAKVCVSDT